jgi:hypothetical protein
MGPFSFQRVLRSRHPALEIADSMYPYLERGAREEESRRALIRYCLRPAGLTEAGTGIVRESDHLAQLPGFRVTAIIRHFGTLLPTQTASENTFKSMDITVQDQPVNRKDHKNIHSRLCVAIAVIPPQGFASETAKGTELQGIVFACFVLLM